MYTNNYNIIYIFCKIFIIYFSWLIFSGLNKYREKQIDMIKWLRKLMGMFSMIAKITPTSDAEHISNPLEAKGLEIEDQIDIYSQEKLSTIKEERFQRGSDFYVACCESRGGEFFFEGGRFVEHFVKEGERNRALQHPFTREPITSFAVYKATPEAPDLVYIFGEKEARLHVNCLPILLSDPERSDKERGIYYFMLGECYVQGKDCHPDIDRAISYLTEGAKLGNDDARHNLALLLSEQGKAREALLWTIKPWEGREIQDVPVEGINEIANCFERIGEKHQAFLFFHEAACRGNPYGIAKVIRYYDQGFGIGRDLTKVENWKAFIPSEWRSKSSLEYLSHIVKSPRLAKLTTRLDIPEVLKNSNRPQSLPNPEDFSSKSFFSRMRSLLRI